MSKELQQLLANLDVQARGEEIYAFVEEAFPLPRSITGDGVRQTLDLLARGELPLQRHEVPTGTPVLDWSVPKEWNLRRAWFKDPQGRTVVDSDQHNLHVLGYSVPTQCKLDLDRLQEHLYSLPQRPDAIPYRTSYYQERWGFCLSHRQREALLPGEYEVCIDADLEAGHLSYGEVVLPGESDRSVLLSAHTCHPSLANDNLSALGVAAALARLLQPLRLRHTYRFLFAPGTIGAITWLARNGTVAKTVEHGLVLANLGDGGDFHYKRSRRRQAAIDRLLPLVLAEQGAEHAVEDFVPFGYDERQFCSPGFDLPVGCLSRSPWGRFPEYHTSDDNLDLVQPRYLGESLQVLLHTVYMLESNRRYRNLAPYGEPQLGRRGLYRTLGGDDQGRERELAMLWVLNQSDGQQDLLTIAEGSGQRFERLAEAANSLQQAGLLAAE